LTKKGKLKREKFPLPEEILANDCKIFTKTKMVDPCEKNFYQVKIQGNFYNAAAENGWVFKDRECESFSYDLLPNPNNPISTPVTTTPTVSTMPYSTPTTTPSSSIMPSASPSVSPSLSNQPSCSSGKAGCKKTKNTKAVRKTRTTRFRR
jgi:hypothetical protein